MIYLQELAENIVSSLSSDRIVIICKDVEEKIIVSLLNQTGWKSKIQTIVTENDLLNWYEKALRGKYSKELGENVLQNLIDEISIEFPATDITEFSKFLKQRKYDNLDDILWK
ncbi:MAG: HaeII family restriction endonuclease [Bacteroidales bacterium]|nr:HaeII family restriction endonuclease [Bacteroidales bacterium]